MSSTWFRVGSWCSGKKKEPRFEISMVFFPPLLASSPLAFRFLPLSFTAFYFWVSSSMCLVDTFMFAGVPGINENGFLEIDDWSLGVAIMNLNLNASGDVLFSLTNRVTCVQVFVSTHPVTANPLSSSLGFASTPYFMGGISGEVPFRLSTTYSGCKVFSLVGDCAPRLNEYA